MGQRLLVTELFTVGCAIFLALVLLSLFSEVASAHRPLFASDRADAPDSAIRVPDATVSHVVYVELALDAPHAWFVFEVDGPKQVPMKVGLPSAVSQDDFKPVVMLFGPGWSGVSEELPFTPPQGDAVGSVTLPEAEKPHRFYEPVTGTESQIIVDTQVMLPEAGTYYGVVYDPGGQAGKAWVSIGQSEGFSWRDVGRMPGWIRKVRQFHEVSGWPRWAWMGTLGLIAVGLVLGRWLARRQERV